MKSTLPNFPLSWAATANPCTANCWGSTNWGGTAVMLADFSYSYDYVGKMMTRENAVTSSIEAFCYDKVNRLIDYALASSCTGTGRVTVAYNDAGNITKKTDVCSTANCYAYPSATSARPHAISSLSGTFNGATNPAFSYDNNGNMYDGAGRSVVYTAFNMSQEMTQGTTKLCWTYDADHARVRMDKVSSCGGEPSSSTYYLNDSVSGLMSEKIVSGSTTTTKDYLQVSGVLIGTRTKVGTGDPSIAYYVVDHLGSIAVTTDEAGVLVCRMTYDPWGKSTATGGSCTPPTRGFTSEESINIDGLIDLVNLNARVYDPVLGRFMAADPISNPYEMQSLNLYTYALNSPLAIIDRSGLCGSSFDEESRVETVVICGSLLRPPSLGNLVFAAGTWGGGLGGTGGPEVPNIWEYADPFVEHGPNGSNNTGPATSKTRTVPKPKAQSCGFVSLTGACAIQTGVTELPQVGWSKALRYAQAIAAVIRNANTCTVSGCSSESILLDAYDEQVAGAYLRGRLSDGLRLVNGQRTRQEQGFGVSEDGTYSNPLESVCVICENFRGTRPLYNLAGLRSPEDRPGHVHPLLNEAIPGQGDGLLAMRSMSGTAYVITSSRAVAIGYNSGTFTVRVLAGAPFTLSEQRTLQGYISGWSQPGGGMPTGCRIEKVCR